MISAQEASQFNFPGFTPNEIQELLSLFQSPDDGSRTQTSGSEGSSTRTVYSVDERKRRRMKSNRESARRSRWRKQRHLENLTEQLNRLKVENRALKNRLGTVQNHRYLLWRENDRLRSESTVLGARLSNLRHILVAMQAMQQAK